MAGLVLIGRFYLSALTFVSMKRRSPVCCHATTIRIYPDSGLGVAILSNGTELDRTGPADLLGRQQAVSAPMVRVILRAAVEIVFAMLFLIGIRSVVVTGLGAQSWYEVLTAFPDFVIWIWAFALILMARGIIRMRLILQARRTGMGAGNRISGTPVL